jgi:hypothetical protein
MTPLIPNLKLQLTLRAGARADSAPSARKGQAGPKVRDPGNRPRFCALGWLVVVLSLASLLGPDAGPLRAQDSTNSDSGTDFNSFQIIAQRNIFDPTRSGRLRSYGTKRRPAAQSFTFCGVGQASFGKQHYAVMFDGFGAPGRQLYVGDVINGFKITQIPPPEASNNWRASVQLQATNNQTTNLFVGMHMRREEGGPWTATDEPEPTPVEPSASADATAKTGDSDSTATASSTSSTAESDVVKRLRLQREQEDK